MVRLLALALFVVSCNESFNAGRGKHVGLLPVDERNPVILLNDSPYENWMGEYAMLLANSGGPRLAGIIVTTGGINTKYEEIRKGWDRMVKAARDSRMPNIPELTGSIPELLARPANGDIEKTEPIHSEGARLIVTQANSLGQPYRPLVVAAGSRLTDVASAYLMDRSIVDRVVVVASVGMPTSSGGADMSKPNGEMDPLADVIVTTHFRYIQVSARYSSRQEVPDDKLQNLPGNAFGQWIAEKQPGVWALTDAADQVAIEAVGIPGFVAELETVSPDTTADTSSAGPPLQLDKNGGVFLVSKISTETAINRFWEMLHDPKIFPPSPDASADTK